MPFLLQLLVFIFNFTALGLENKAVRKEFCLEKLDMCSRLEKTCAALYNLIVMNKEVQSTYDAFGTLKLSASLVRLVVSSVFLIE